MKKVLKVVLGVVVFLIIGVNSLFFYKGSQSSKMPNKQTFQNMVLGECSEKPNCVSTFHKKDSNHKIPPLKITKEQFKKVELPNNCNIVVQNESYIYARCVSSIYKFVDDLELLYLSDTSELHLRSASRVGYSDLGANQKRANNIFEQFVK